LRRRELKTPVTCTEIGEAGSGGALAIGVGDRVLMLEYSTYSVISPEGCASILWRNGEQAKDAADALRRTAQDLEQLGVIDTIIPEPLGGAHRDAKSAIQAAGDALEETLMELVDLDGGVIKARRRDKFLAMGKKGLS